MRSDAQSVTRSWPEVERSGVCHDLGGHTNLRADGFFNGRLIDKWKHKLLHKGRGKDGRSVGENGDTRMGETWT